MTEVVEEPGVPEECYKCGGTKFSQIDRSYEEGYTVEYSVVCDQCETLVAHWAYGHFTC